MTVFDIKDAEGRVFAFEITNSFRRRRGLCNLVARIPGCRLVKRPCLLSWFREAEFCEFDIDGIRFVVEEPFGDNSRWWIGPRPPRWVPQIATVRQAFIDDRDTPFWVRGAIVAAFVAGVSAILWALK